jgi:prepilin-type N-terminal cleavage/methylation domain-containing protein
MLNATTSRKDQGFTLIEMLIVVAVILVLGAVAVPRVMNTVSDINLRYFATNYSGLLQSARIQAVRKNTFYTIQPVTLPSGTPAYYIDLPNSGTYTGGDPVLPVGSQITVFPGIGSGAPNEGTFIAGLNFTVNPGGNAPSFNARGLPCVATANTCPQTPGQGFVLFVSKSALTGNVNWASIIINPSGRVQIWTCDSNGNWIQR